MRGNNTIAHGTKAPGTPGAAPLRPRTAILARLFRLGLLLVFLLAATPARAAEVSAAVDTDRPAPGQPVELTVTVRGGQGTPDLSGLKDFTVRSSGRSSSVQIVNGRRTDEIRHHFLLAPRRGGTLEIPALPVSVDGQALATRPIQVNVADRPAQDPEEQEAFVTAEVSRNATVPGLPLTYTFRLHNRAPLANSALRKPSFDGFAVRELGEKTGRTTVRGREYQVHELSWLLTPLRAGTLTVEPASLSVDLVQPRAPRGSALDPFDLLGDSFFAGPNVKRLDLSTGPVRVEVRDLPPFPGPGEFSGLVGRFSLEAALPDRPIAVGESATATLTVSGQGNVADAAGPKIAPPPGLKVYEDAPEEDVKATAQGLSGRKTFRYALVGLSPGTHQIGPFTLAFFDPEENRYATLSAGPLRLEVRAAPGGADAPGQTAPGGPGDSREPARSPAQGSGAAPAGPAASARPPAPGQDHPGAGKPGTGQSGPDILPFKGDLAVLADQSAPPLWAFLALFLAPALAWGGARLARVLRERSRLARESWQARAGAELRRAASAPGEQECAACLDRALALAVRGAAGVPGDAPPGPETARLLDLAERPGLAPEALALARELAALRWGGGRASAPGTPAPGGADHCRALLDRVSALVRELTR